jgi:hypothetical protein
VRDVARSEEEVARGDVDPLVANEEHDPSREDKADWSSLR